MMESKMMPADGGEIGVSVFLDGGDVLDAEAFSFEMAKARNAEPNVEFEKESRQLKSDPRTLRWAEPRIAPEDLLYFLDVNVWHRRCVLVKSLLVAGLGWQLLRNGEVVYDPLKSGGVPDDPAARFLARPTSDGMQPLDEILHRFLVDYYALGNAYLEVVRDRKGRVAELYHVPGRTMRRHARFEGYFQVRGVETIPFRNFGHREEGRSDTSVAAARSEMLHLYTYDPLDDFYGMPDWYAALGTMGLDRTVLEFNTRLFSNALMAHMAIVVEGGKLSAGAKSAIKTFLQERGTGPANAGRILLLEDERSETKIRFEKLNLDIKDILIVQAQQHFRDIVISAHGVPPRILGIVTPGQLGATGEVEGQLRTFLETVLRPGQRQLETLLSMVLMEFGEGYRVRFAEMDVTDMKADAEFYSKMIERGVFTTEEVRQIIDSGARG